ncbi:MAG: hypothetical protein PHI63_05340 [Patescibacteria group bacterium]|nr:hypothetical protein [Patescibacteria group bacterium]
MKPCHTNPHAPGIVNGGRLASRAASRGRYSRGILAALISLSTVAGSVAPLQGTAAHTFNPNHVLTDAELYDASSVSTTAIQRFLEQHGSVLATFTENVEGERLSAARIIHRVTQSTGVSSKFLLAVVEREKGLLRKGASVTKASDLDWATGYSCFSGGCNDKYKGFFNQIESAAITQKIYTERAATFAFQVGKPTKTFDGFTVTPENQATANLFIYTPYVGHAPELGITNGLGGNRLFNDIWQQFFTDARYPDGLVLTDGQTYWKIESGKKRRFKTEDIFRADYHPAEAILTDAKVIATYADGPDIAFADHTLVRSLASSQVLLLDDGKQRPVLEETTLAQLDGFRIALTNFNDIPQVSTELLDPYPLGAPITATVSYPMGKLFRDETGALSWVENSVRHPVDAVVAQVNWKDRVPEPTAAAELAVYPTGSGVPLRDGSFVLNSNGTYYVISGGERRKIVSAALFDRLFGSARRDLAVAVSDEVLALSAPGLNIDYLDDTITDPPEPPAPPAQPPYQVGTVNVTPDGFSGYSGQSFNVTVNAVNAGSAAWKPGDIRVRVNNGDPLAFNEPSVPPGGRATFTAQLTLPATPGLQPQSFTLIGPGDVVLTQFAKFAIVRAGVAAEITGNTLPVAVKNTWRPVTVTVKLKNVSADQTWKSQKTALKITGNDGKTSPFYDINDWVRADVAAVPVGKKTIAPGETGEFKFTLKVKGLKPGTYQLRFALELLDVKKTVLINGQETWLQTVRVDK